jgi:hypothetical protein
LLLITSNDGIAHITHLGGALFAWVYFMLESRGVNLLANWSQRKEKRLHKAVQKTQEKVGQVMLDVDQILKKISEHGIGSLTAEEKEKLQKASDLKRQQRSNIIDLDDYRKRQ